MTWELEDLRGSPNELARHYSAFRVSERLLLTGHSHQAWPDVGFAAQQQAWQDAAQYVDEKWEHAFERADRVRRGYATLLGDRDGDITLAPNTHELVVRFLSALPLRERPKLVTTDAEFHTIRRQLDRLAEERVVEVVKVPGYPAWGAVDRLCAEVDDRTAAVLVSAVFHERGVIVPWLGRLAEKCQLHGAELLVDAYHALGAIPFELKVQGLEGAFVVGGGYKYLQLGEGNCFLRAPAGGTLRPVFTGWFSEFAELAESETPGEVRYGEGPARFAGSTFDPTSHYRGAAVMDFFDTQGLDPEFLRAVSEHQVGHLARGFRALDLDPNVVHLDETVRMEDRGGFLALTAPRAGWLCAGLRERGVHTDVRGSTLRFGPAPYLRDGQLAIAIDALRDVVLPGIRRSSGATTPGGSPARGGHP
ncbi:MAG: aminotransferase class V-fold PLP-dependent enzyme [Longimicrobiales bacterium]|nr:aminotransferase class V-fold PLP-dependent enzyme [Longimicrobiales bacterium]